jgi:hypothetical protein
MTFVKKKKSLTERAPLTTEQLERLSVDAFVRLKLSDDERARLRLINEKRNAERLDSVARLTAEAAPIVAELQDVGLKIQNIGELLGMSGRYERAIPILLRHIQMPYSDAIRDTIARALAVPEPAVRNAWPILVAEYRKAPMGRGIVAKGDTKEFRLGFKDGLACALSVAVTDETLGELIDLAKDRSNGENRILLLSALRKSKNPLAQVAINELANDPDLQLEIASWRKKR